MTEDEILERALADSRVAPDYTMGALAQRTGVPSDTIRSWERRYGFPKPVRTETNQRRYSEQDIALVIWLREQTEVGQGISEAISMLKSRMREAARGSVLVQERKPAMLSPEDNLLYLLRHGDTEAAQSSWDDLAIALSPGAVLEALMRLYLRLWHSAFEEQSFSSERAHAFLLRKAMVLLDHAAPDSGLRTFALVIANDKDTIPATLLGAVLARGGQRVITPFPLVASLMAVNAVLSINPDSIVLVGTSAEQATSFSRLIPEVTVHRWNPDRSDENDDPLADILHTIKNR